MRILKIKISNITSFRGDIVIDFTSGPLSQAPLFAITGDTGSGKSTILDAVCLALYNRAPRYNLKEKGAGVDEKTNLQPYDTRNALRRGEKEGGASVTFSTAEGTFEATWSVRVKRTGTYDSPTRTLTQTSPKHRDFDPRDVQSEIERLIGLDYDQFTRTVILAQNRFADFLRAKRDEKSKLLEKITGTEIYTAISRVIYEQAKSARQDYDSVQKEYDTWKGKVIDSVSVQELQSKRNLTDSQIKQMETRLEYMKSQIAWYKTYADLDARTGAATAAYNEANRINVSLTQDRERLQRYDDVEPIRDKVVSVRFHEQKIREAQQQREQIARSLEESEKSASAMDSRLTEARENLDKVQTQLSQTQPLLKKAYEIQHDIEMKESVKRDNLTELNKTRKEIDSLTARIADTHNRLKALEARCGELKAAMQALAPHQPMLDQYGSVLEKLRSYGGLMDEAEKTRKRQHDIINELDKLKSDIEKLEAQVNATSQKKDILEGNRTKLQNSILGIDYDTLQKNYNLAFTQRAELQSARRLWDALAAEYTELEANEKAITALDITIEARKSQLKDLELKTTECRKEYEIYEKYYNLSQADNIKDLKRNLKEGQPCPVCGATHHPGLSHADAESILYEVVGNAERDRDKAREKYNAYEERYNAMRNSQSTDKERLNNLRDKLSDTQQRIERYREEWKRYVPLDKTFADSSANVNADARRIMIIQLTENADRTVEETSRKLDEYNKCHSDIERYTSEIETLSRSIAELSARHASLLMQKGTNEGNLATIADNLRSNSENAHELYSDLEKFLTVADWRRLIRTDNKLLRDNITEFYNKRNECEEGLHKVDEERVEAETDLKLLTDSLKREQTNLQAFASRIETAENAITADRNDIFKLFDGEEATAVEQKLTKAVQDARTALETATTNAHQAQQHLSAVRAQMTQSEQERQRMEAEKLSLSTEIDTWISAFNQGHSPVQYTELVDIFASTADIMSLRSKIKEAENNFSLASDRLKAAQEALNAWQSRPEHPDRDTETEQSIRSEIEAVERKRKEALDAVREIDVTLGCNAQAAGEMSRLEPTLREMEQNYTEWDKLNTLVGSANGKAFSFAAQKYTLGFLVEHANSQLALFSPRYRLMQAGDSLDLEIIDQYMSDETRPVSGLSGGETFIVSLALALGLASLSSRRLSIESLFIDEGFGNLDNESLDMVVRALGNLNAQGRKVGIISHTEQIRDNIFPQVQVVRSKASDSTSTIRIAYN